MRTKVTITSDFLCPWCYLGEVRLCKAVASLGLESAVELEWKPFELNPDMPAKGMDRKAYRIRKFGERLAERRDAELTALGREEGVFFNFAAIERACNTRLAHRLHQLASARERGAEYARCVFKAYFEQGQDIGSEQVLLAVMDQLGLDRGEAEAYLSSGGGEAEVSAAEAQLNAARVHGVPQFRIGDRIINGAQSVDAFRRALLAARDSQLSP